MAKIKKAKGKQTTKRKTFRQQALEAWDRYTSKLPRTESIAKDYNERDAFLLGFEKGVKAHQTQRDTDGRPSERECKAAAKALESLAATLDGFEEAEFYKRADEARKLAAALRGGGR